MKKFLNVLLVCLSCFFVGKSDAANVMSVSITATDNNGNSTTVTSPAALLSLTNIVTLDVKLSGTISIFSIAEATYDPTKWGIYFTGGVNTVKCSNINKCGGATSITVNQTGLPQAPSSSPFSFNGLAFSPLEITIAGITGGAGASLPQDLVNVFNNSTVTIGYLYDSGTPVMGADTATLQPDQGTLIHAPSLQTDNKSVIAGDSSFQVTNIRPPSDLSAACPATAGAPTTCVTDGGVAGATGVLSSTTNNNVSGYVIGFWKDEDCKLGNFTFSPNWMAYNYNAITPINYTCSYANTQWRPSYKTGGTTSALGGCSASSPSGFSFFTGAASPNLDTGAIPYLGEDPKQDLQILISNPGKAYTSSSNDSCIKYVYLSALGSSQSTYTSPIINNGDIYGVVVWALNSALTPNYSLAHSNIFYTTGINFALASTDKNSGLSKSKDCFVLTAASGNENSPSVFYWRFLRDAYLTPMGITPFYYQHAKNWAHWLDEHPSLKPSLNFIFEKTGYAFYHTSEFAQKASCKTKEAVHKFINLVSNLLDNKASAEELSKTTFQPYKKLVFQELPSDNDGGVESSSSNKTNFGFDQGTNQQNINVVPDDMDNDPFFGSKVKRESVKPAYEFSLTAGVLIPTDDQPYYDERYSTQPTLLAEVGVARIFWGGSFGYSLGLQGRYLTNTENDKVDVLGTQESYTRTFYAITGEAFLGIHYRNPSFTYIQPSIFVGGGMTRFREEASVQGSSPSRASGITEYSPIYEAGGNLDVSLSNIAGESSAEVDPSNILNEVLFRLSASYNLNQSEALSSTGYFVKGGFVFLLN